MSRVTEASRPAIAKLLLGVVGVLGVLALFVAFATSASAGDEEKVTVNSTANVDDGVCEGPPNDDEVGNCTLHEAIDEVNDGNADIINFHPPVFSKEQPGVIELCEDEGEGDLPEITRDIIIESKNSGVVIDGGSKDDECGDPAENGLLAEFIANGFDFSLNGGKNFWIQNTTSTGIEMFHDSGESLGTVEITGVIIENVVDEGIYVEASNIESLTITNSEISSNGNDGIFVSSQPCDDPDLDCKFDSSVVNITGNRIEGGVNFPDECCEGNGVAIEYIGAQNEGKITINVSENEVVNGTDEGVVFDFFGCSDEGVNVHVDNNGEINGGIWDAVDVSILADKCLAEPEPGGSAASLVPVDPGETSDSFDAVVTVNGNGDIETQGLVQPGGVAGGSGGDGEGVTINVWAGFEESDSSATVEVNDNGRITGEDDGVAVTTHICCGDGNSTMTNVDRNDEITGEGDDGINVQSFAGSSIAAAQQSGVAGVESDADDNECIITVDSNNEVDGVGTDTGHGTGVAASCFAGALGDGGFDLVIGDALPQPEEAGDPQSSGDANTSTISVINNLDLAGDRDGVDIEAWSGSIDGEADENVTTANVTGNGEVGGDNDDGIDIDIASGTPIEEGDDNTATMTLEENAEVGGDGGDGFDLDIFAGGITEGSENNHTDIGIVQNGSIEGADEGGDGINIDSSVCCDEANSNTIDINNNKDEVTGHDGDGVEIDTCCSLNVITVMDNEGNFRGGDGDGFELDVCDTGVQVFGIELPPVARNFGGEPNPVGFNDCLKRDLTNLQIINNSFTDSEDDGIDVEGGTFEDDEIKSVISNNIVEGNGEDGIDLDSTNGINVGPGNEIFGNGTTLEDNGIEIDWALASCEWDAEGQKFPANHNTITQNSIYDNAGLGIDLVGWDADGSSDFSVCGIDHAPGEVGCQIFPETAIAPNDCVPFPELKTQSFNKLVGMACSECTVEIFWVDDDPDNNQGHGEGFEKLVTTEADVDGNFSVDLPCDLGEGELTATATDKLKNTSEFSANLSTLGTFCPTDTPTPTDTSVPPTATNTPVAPTNTPPAGKVCGDVNMDGVTNSIDASLILQLKAALIDSLANESSADVNNDGSITSVDAALILQFTAALIDADDLTCPA